MTTETDMHKQATLTASKLDTLVESYGVRPLRLRGGYGNRNSTIPNYWQPMWVQGLLMTGLVDVPVDYCDSRSRH